MRGHARIRQGNPLDTIFHKHEVFRDDLSREAPGIVAHVKQSMLSLRPRLLKFRYIAHRVV